MKIQLHSLKLKLSLTQQSQMGACVRVRGTKSLVCVTLDWIESTFTFTILSVTNSLAVRFLPVAFQSKQKFDDTSKRSLLWYFFNCIRSNSLKSKGSLCERHQITCLHYFGLNREHLYWVFCRSQIHWLCASYLPIKAKCWSIWGGYMSVDLIWANKRVWKRHCT